VNKHTKCFVEQIEDNDKLLETKIIGTSRKVENLYALGNDALHLTFGDSLDAREGTW
jgi:hypothetical protein